MLLLMIEIKIIAGQSPDVSIDQGSLSEDEFAQLITNILPQTLAQVFVGMAEGFGGKGEEVVEIALQSVKSVKQKTYGFLKHKGYLKEGEITLNELL